MPGGFDKVEAGVNPVVDELVPVDAVLLLEVRVEARVDVLEDGEPGLRVVDKVPEAWGVYDGQFEADARLFDVGGCGLYVYGLWALVGGVGDDLWGVEGGVEEGVYEGGLAEAGLAWMGQLCGTR